MDVKLLNFLIVLSPKGKINTGYRFVTYFYQYKSNFKLFSETNNILDTGTKVYSIITTFHSQLKTLVVRKRLFSLVTSTLLV